MSGAASGLDEVWHCNTALVVSIQQQSHNMAPKTGPKKRKDTSEDNVFREEEEPKQEQINLGDAPSLKRALDDAVIQVRAVRLGSLLGFAGVPGSLGCAAGCFRRFPRQDAR